jgi:hypothetical protein
MPFDGTDLTMLENPTLLKLGQVERLLATEQQWCKGSLQDSDGRRCLVGAMKAAEARQILEPIVLRAAREVGGKRYWRIEFFNDDPRTTHDDVLRVLRRARENVIAEIAGASHRQLWRQRFSRMFRALCSGSAAEACAALRFGTGAAPAERPPLLRVVASPSMKPEEGATQELCEAR